MFGEVNKNGQGRDIMEIIIQFQSSEYIETSTRILRNTIARNKVENVTLLEVGRIHETQSIKSDKDGEIKGRK